MVKIIDLNFQGQPGVIAAFLMETPDGPVLIETGPHSTIDALENGLKLQGYQLSDIQHLFVTHIHLDHAGAAWVFAKHGAKIYVHPLGLPHLENPEKLLSSAKRIYQDKMESLWGDLQPIPLNQLRAVRNNEKIIIGDAGFRARHTPGHAVHHIAWEVKNFVFTGDVAGVRPVEGGPVMPPCPPPDINLEDWIKSLAYLRTRRYETIYLTHFGAVNQVKKHFIELEGRLRNWANWVRPFWEQGDSIENVVPLFEKYVQKQLENSEISDEGKRQYELANPTEMSVAGLFRYWSKKTSPN
ncbi:MAG: MBL fold metallo-hydrolase [Saprospiraceae bacterium]|nr:MBL fold metallo-hydrolase [Saprospiraceae bacterium]MCF8250397.1 MBL fold metallo-hydrolase [Saprospiraceae bacterium]MCF8281533.1 MBL fold metallo-hydrolase [Bacteroidales bacterium]MCF8312228.1 MBL fold metallo-hydrolase [Saprospiraceae bacterium]MCF8440569.1 MBL fold metallo-hydrolase [Saprospiraceae bacterium]